MLRKAFSETARTYHKDIAGCIFNQGQIHGLVHIIIIFSPHPHKVRDAVRDLRRFFVSIFLLLFFIAIQSYTIFF